MPKYDLDKIKFTCDPPTFGKAVDLYESKKVKDVINEFGIYRAKVQGTQTYSVSVSETHYDRGDCNCYLGQNDTLCTIGDVSLLT